MNASLASHDTRGEAPPLVLLHGWAMSPAVWAPLRALLGDRPVLAPALPGHAGAVPARHAAPEDLLAAWSDALLARLPQQATLVGWSLGALLALDIAARHPMRVARLVLISSTARFVADVPDTAAVTQPATAWPGLAAETVAAFCNGFAQSPQATLRRFLALQCLGEATRKVLADQLESCLAPEHRGGTGEHAGLRAGLELLACADLRPVLAQVRQLCLLIHGEHDALMPVAAARMLAQALPDAQLAHLPAGGHALPLSHAADCARLIERFMHG